MFILIIESMLEPDFIFQGPTSSTHAKRIGRYLSFPGIEKIILSIAFVNEEGVRLIENDLRPYAKKTIIFSGIRNEITSFQGLVRLLDLGVSLYTVDTGARGIVFHPKIYFIKTKSRAGIITGSANLTVGGLNNNVEASLGFETDLMDLKNKEFVELIENQLMLLPQKYPDNVRLIKTEAELVKLKNDGIIIDESEVAPPRPITERQTPDIDFVPRIRLDTVFIPRSIRRTHTKTKADTETKTPPSTKKSSGLTTNLQLMWESKPLSERDLTIPSGTNTHQTGSINLDKGKLDPEIDHRHYFRDEVFNHLHWITREGTTEEAEAGFSLVIKGISYGEFRLHVRHNTDKTITTYKQRNAMTRLSWGDMREFIANRNLIGRTLSIYRNTTNPESFVIEID